MSPLSSPEQLRMELEELYRKYNRLEFVHPDPLEFLYRYELPGDREVVALVASTLAYGKVELILRAVATVLTVMGPSPAAYLRDTSLKRIRRDLRGFRHRMTSGDGLAAVLEGVREAVLEYGSLNECFVEGLSEEDRNVIPALCSFVGALSAGDPEACSFHLANPEKGSASKRLHLFLRWMVRSDDVDPGGWDGVSPSMLVVPLDTHMHRICRALGFTDRKQPDLRAALEATEAFARIVPEDPVRYDFCLTRPGIRGEGDLGRLISAD